ncbi:uncharacterized protein LOC129567114 [Sitodiplosis mosellana]|uniref:uncharacterized protein LOC129567114 n=1 Tax=Sitodiplosis mosellana TaxID=263140 RepID=UPI002443FBC9|nr:uncharacterized protein LOC129567114 [Sitodiplosis mosellana]
MDSDDNCLVIDESMDVDMEVTSTTQSRAETPVSGIETSKDKTPHENWINSSHKSSEDGTPKQKERNADRNRNKSTSTPSKDRKRSMSKRSHYIRLTPNVFREKTLNVTAQKHQLYNMQFSVKGSLLIGETPSVYPAQTPFPDLNLTQLLNWPGIKINISLEHFSFNHELKENCVRDIVFGDEVMLNIDTQKNPAETRYLQKVPSSKTYAMVCKEMVETYVKSLMEAAPLYEVGPSKLPEIEKSFQKILDNIATVPFASIQTRITHTRFLNEQKYYRVFDNDSGAVAAADNNNLKVRLRETINPEAIFWIRRCDFTLDQIDVWYDAIDEFFENIFVKKGDRIKETLRDRFKKCLTLKCESCNESFEGALWAVKLKDHIKQKHFVDKEWTCVKCKRSWEQFELLQMGWKHDCSFNDH